MAKSSAGGRYTPKKTGDTQPGDDTAPQGATNAAPAYRSTGRYTPPIAREVRQSAPWVAIVMFTLLLLGLLTIIGNYMNLLPGDASNWYLLLGLGFITGGFVTATQLH